MLISIAHTEPVMTSKLPSKRRQDLQAVRGIAILAVLGFHFYPNQFPNGYLGVDQFFVLSGFLMCMLLTKASTMSIASAFLHFYSRRFRRILPLYFFIIFLSLIALYTIFSVTAVSQNQSSALRAIFFTSNRPKTGEESYFEKLSLAIDIFTHTWSLSVEVQFYLIAPIIFVVGELLDKTKLGYYFILGVASFAYYYISSQSIAFNSVFARIWQFLIGMIVYLMQRKNTISFHLPEHDKLLEKNDCEGTDNSSKINAKYSVLFPIIILVVYPNALPATIMRLLTTILTGRLIILSVDNGFFGNRWLTYVGDLSYTLYLVHWPIYAYCKLSYPANSYALTAGLITSLLFAVVVYESFEKWYLTVSNLTITILVAALLTANLVLIYKDIMFNSQPPAFDGRLDGVTPSMTVDDAIRLNTYWQRTDVGGLSFPDCIERIPGKTLCDYKSNGTEFKLTMLGNSYVPNHLKLFAQECGHRAYHVSAYWESGCEPLAAFVNETHCKKHLEDFHNFLKEEQPDYAFIFTRFFATGLSSNFTDLVKDLTYLEMRSQIKKFLPNIKKKLYVLDALPIVKEQYTLQVAKDLKNGRNVDEIHEQLMSQSDNYKMARRRTEAIVNECGSQCELIDYTSKLFNQTSNRFEYFDSRGFLYIIGTNHLSAHGLELVGTDLQKNLPPIRLYEIF